MRTAVGSGLATQCRERDRSGARIAPAYLDPGITAASEMKRYTETIPGSVDSFEMVPIPKGTFLIGSPPEEAGHNGDEGPQRRISIEPFWMGRCEVTWDEYDLFTFPVDVVEADGRADAISRPTKPFVDMSFGMGHHGFPAISMTHHAANKYCQWLSAKTRRFYRLPTEAEWEYACRAGTTTAYSFSGDPALLDRHAWHAGNSRGKYQRVGTKEPKPWGLYDMHGNVMEWALDQYVPDRYRTLMNGARNPWLKATLPYPHVVRGGSWADAALALRSAARRGSDASWKMQDPQLPKEHVVPHRCPLGGLSGCPSAESSVGGRDVPLLAQCQRIIPFNPIRLFEPMTQLTGRYAS